MIKHHHPFYAFKDHPILIRIREAFRSLNTDDGHISLLSKHVRFVYPKIISFSFDEYPADWCDFREFSSIQGTDDDSIMLRHGARCENLVLGERLSMFFSDLLRATEIVKFRPIIALDMRYAHFFDQTLISKILDIRDKKGLNIQILLIANENIKPFLNDEYIQRGVHLLFSLDELSAYINELIQMDKYIFTVKLSDNVSLKQLESIIVEKDLSELIKTALLVIIDLSKASSISCFSINTLNLLIHTLAHHYGILFRFEYKKPFSKVSNKLLEFRTTKVNRFFLIHRAKQEELTEKNVRQFGVYLFDGNSYRILLNESRSFMYKVGEMFKDFLQEPITISYDYEGDSRKVKSYRYLNRCSIIINIINELVENAIRHSNGVGYLSITISKYQLFIFVGDCGVGLRKGILNNYKMDQELTDDTRTLECAFNLPVFKNRRTNHEFSDEYGGSGLADMLYNVFGCKGKIMFRTGDKVGAYMNPVQRNYFPPAIHNSNFYLSGTQFMIIIPLDRNFIDNLPKTKEDFLECLD